MGGDPCLEGKGVRSKLGGDTCLEGKGVRSRLGGDTWLEGKGVRSRLGEDPCLEGKGVKSKLGGVLPARAFVHWCVGPGAMDVVLSLAKMAMTTVRHKSKLACHTVLFFRWSTHCTTLGTARGRRGWRRAAPSSR